MKSMSGSRISTGMAEIESQYSRSVVVIGAGGHAKVAIEALRHSGWQVAGCTDENPATRSIVGAPVLGNDDLLPELYRTGIRFAFVALGNNRLRQAKSESLIALGFQLPTAMAPSAVISPTASIGSGLAIFGGAVVNAEARIGDFAIINTNASIDHDCLIGEGAHIAPGCTLAGCVEVGARAFLGAGTIAIPGVKIGADCVLGAGSVVVCDVPPGVSAFGVPARVRRNDSNLKSSADRSE